MRYRVAQRQAAQRSGLTQVLGYCIKFSGGAMLRETGVVAIAGAHRLVFFAIGFCFLLLTILLAAVLVYSIVSLLMTFGMLNSTGARMTDEVALFVLIKIGMLAAGLWGAPAAFGGAKKYFARAGAPIQEDIVKSSEILAHIETSVKNGAENVKKAVKDAEQAKKNLEQ